MNKFVGKEALEEVVNKINDLETHVLKVENNHVSDAYTKEESDNKYLRKGNYATLAYVQSNNIKVINLTDYQDKELPIKNAEPFFCKITDLNTSSIFGDLRNILASHYRWFLNMRIDCFMHDVINEESLRGEGVLYSIIIGDPTGGTTKYKLYGFLHRNSNKEWELLKADLRTVIDDIEGMSALYIAEMVVPMFGEDLPSRVTSLEDDLNYGYSIIGDVSQVDLPYDNSDIVKAINRLVTRTELLMTRILNLESLIGYNPPTSNKPDIDPWTGKDNNIGTDIL